MQRRYERDRGLAERVYRLLMAVYPRKRRNQDGEDMARMFSDIYRYEPETRGWAGRLRLGIAMLRDIATGAIKERSPLLDHFVVDLRYGLRRLRDNPTLSVAAVLTLAVGIGAVTSIYSFVEALVLHPLPYPEIERIVVLGETTPRRGLEGDGWTHAPELRQWRQLDSLESVAALRPFFVTMTGAGDPEEVIGYRATANFFMLLGVEPLIGRTFSSAVSEIEPDVVVLGHAFWQRRFDGDPGAVGRSLRLNGREMVIVGVMPRGAEFPMGTDLWVPLVPTPQDWLRPIARLAEGATVAQLRAELEPVTAAVAESRPDTHADVRIEVQPILENITFNTASALSFLMGAAAFLLLLVCGNVANMQLARATARRREMAMRMALGARRSRLVRQLLTEGLALAAPAGAVGGLFATWGIRVLRVGLADERWRFYFAGVDEVGVNTSVLAFAAVVSLGSVVVFGLVPALHCSRVDLNDAIKQPTGGASFGRGRLQRGLVALQVALSIVLLVGAGLMARSISAFARFEPGVDTDVLSVRLRMPRPDDNDPVRARAFFDEAVTRLAAVPGIASVAIADRVPATAASQGVDLEIEPVGAEEVQVGRAERHVVGGTYFGTLGVSLVAGRAFESRDGADAPGVVIVSSALAGRLSPGRAAEAVGRRLRLGSDAAWLTVIGVASDVAHAWNDPRPSLAVYLPHAQSPSRSMRLLLRVSGDRESIFGAVREEIWTLDQAVVVFAPESIDDNIATRARPIRSMAELVGWMAAAALLVCLGGVYALGAYSAGQRTREIGVRLALGATRGNVVRMLVLHALWTAGMGLCFGLAIAYVVAWLLASFMRGLLAVDPLVFMVLAGSLLSMATLASWLPARRATDIDPAVTLQAE